MPNCQEWLSGIERPIRRYRIRRSRAAARFRKTSARFGERVPQAFFDRGGRRVCSWKKTRNLEREERIKRGEQVVGHDSETVLDILIEKPRRLRFDDIEKPEKKKSGELPQPAGRAENENEPQGNDFIPDDTAWIVRSAITRRPSGGGNSSDETGEKEKKKLCLTHPRAQQRESQNGEHAAHGSGGNWRKTAAETAGDEMRWMRK